MDMVCDILELALCTQQFYIAGTQQFYVENARNIKAYIANLTI